MQRSTTVVIIIATLLFGASAALVGYLRDRSAGEPFDAQKYLEKSIATAAGQAPGSSLIHASTEGLDDTGRVHGEVRGYLLVRFGSAAPGPSNEPPPLLGAPHAAAAATCTGGDAYTHVRSGTRGGRTLEHTWEAPSRPNCGPVVGKPPRCTFKQIWQKAIAKGAPHPAYADVDLSTETGNGQTVYRWRFELMDRPTNAPSTIVFHAEFDDDC